MLGMLYEVVRRGLVVIWRNRNNLKVGGNSPEEVEIILLPVVTSQKT